ncbi:MAG: helix-turn-helix domain-containing protein [Chloroflexi bacterium]|nr:helix-turn-helix domain-containing protein [Chloroflexota bacterium]
MAAERVFIEPAEIAERLGISVAAVYRYLNAGVIPSRRLDHRILVHRADFERWCREGNAEKDERKKDENSLIEKLLAGEIELELVIRARKNNARLLGISDGREERRNQ